jgi:nucleoside-diphosphate-sugar epimerase
MLVAVTGANGFLGGHAVAALHGAGHGVRALVRRGARRDRIEAFVEEWRTGGLGDSRSLARLVDGAEAVVHIAMDWKALGKGLIPNLEGNLRPSLRLLEAARTFGARQFLFVSSLEAAWPGSLYGAFKAAVEAHLKAYHHAHGMNASAWRPATMIGVNPRLERSHWFEAVRRAKRGERIRDVADSDVVAVEDVADALALAVGDPAVAGQLYNLADVHAPGPAVAAMARALAASEPHAAGRLPLPDPAFDKRQALSFFERHGRPAALRRGPAGVERYLRDLMQRIAGPS